MLYVLLVFLENHAYDHRRLTLVRYETLSLTKPEHKLTMMTSMDTNGSNRISKTEVDEYIITAQVRAGINSCIFYINYLNEIYICTIS